MSVSILSKPYDKLGSRNDYEGLDVIFIMKFLFLALIVTVLFTGKLQNEMSEYVTQVRV